MKKFKNNLIKREQMIVSAIDSSAKRGTLNLGSPNTVEESMKKLRFLKPQVHKLSEDTTEYNEEMENRINNLQKRNEDLKMELKSAQRMYTDLKYERETPIKLNEAWKTHTEGFYTDNSRSASKRGASEPRSANSEREWENEKKSLKAQMNVLQKELDKTNQNHDRKLKQYYFIKMCVD